MRRVGPPASWIYPALVPNIHKWLPQHRKVLFNLSLSLTPCPLAQQSQKKWHVLYDETPADLPQDYDVLPFSPSSNNRALFIPNLLHAQGPCTCSSFAWNFFLNILSCLVSSSHSVSTKTMTPHLSRHTSPLHYQYYCLRGTKHQLNLLQEAKLCGSKALTSLTNLSNPRTNCSALTSSRSAMDFHWMDKQINNCTSIFCSNDCKGLSPSFLPNMDNSPIWRIFHSP